MNTTMLFAEIIVIGLQSFVWILFLVLSVFGTNWITIISVALKDWQAFIAIIFVPIIYTLGIIIDRLSDILTDPWNERIKKQIIGNTEYPSTVMRFALGQNNPTLNMQLEYTRTRMRIMRASAINFALTTVFILTYISSRLTGLPSKEEVMYIVFVLIAGILLVVSSLHVWRSLLKDHLGLIKSNYKYFADQELNLATRQFHK
jgi:hypothetical protein